MKGVEKPGCYGSIIAYVPADATCSACKLASECGESAYESFVEMRKTMDVSALSSKFEVDRIKSGKRLVKETAISDVKPTSAIASRAELLDWQKIILEDDSLPTKPRKLIGSIFRKGYSGDHLLASLRAGINPFSGKTPKILDMACEMLSGGGFIKSDLHRAYMETGMTKRTAHSQVSIVVAALNILGVTYDEHDTGKVKFKGVQ